jgi:hypothetical protein
MMAMEFIVVSPFLIVFIAEKDKLLEQIESSRNNLESTTSEKYERDSHD